MKALAVTCWNTRYENNRTRDMKSMQWVPVPNKHDGMGYTELMDHDDAMSHMGAWLLILQVASKCPQRGLLIDDRGREITSRSLARMTRGESTVFDAAIPRLVDIGWLTWVDIEEMTQPSEITGLASNCGETAGKLPGNVDRIEENGIEQNGMCDKKVIDELLKELRSKIRKRWSVERWIANSTLDRLLLYGSGWPGQFSKCQSEHGCVTRDWVDASLTDGSITFHTTPRSYAQLKKQLTNNQER